MNLASLFTEDIYRHKNGLKHINTINNEGYSALFVVNTPVFNDSGVAHAVEHMVFRGSKAFPQPESLFQLNSLTDAKINASTLANTTYFHCQSQCSYTFMLAINYLLNGLFYPVFTAEDVRCEVHEGSKQGVIYRELLGAELENTKSRQKAILDNKKEKNIDKNEFCYGGTSASIGKLSLNDISSFHQLYYQASNITLVTANADIEQISALISLLPKQQQPDTAKQVNVTLTSGMNHPANENDEHHQKKYSPTIKQLMAIYHLWLQDPYYQEIDDYRDIESTSKALVCNTDRLAERDQSKLISPLVSLSNKLIKKAINYSAVNNDIKNLVNKTILPQLFSKLYQQTKKQLKANELNHHKNLAYASDQQNGLWLTKIADTDQQLATITSYIISAYPRFLAARCQGHCYAIQALAIEDSAFLAIYSAFDVDPNTRLKEIPLGLLKLSQDKHFISMSLALAKVKYCQAYQLNNNQVMNISTTNISTYIQALANR